MRFKLNTQLAQYSQERSLAKRDATSPQICASYSTWRWRICDRLNATDIEELIKAFKAGTPKWKLAERYGIGLSSIKKPLREHGINKVRKKIHTPKPKP